MSRWLPWLRSWQPELFLGENLPKSTPNGTRHQQYGFGSRSTRRAIDKGESPVTRRIAFRVRDGNAPVRTCITSGLPWHWLHGHQQGRRRHNLSGAGGDPNVKLHEAKVSFVM